MSLLTRLYRRLLNLFHRRKRFNLFDKSLIDSGFRSTDEGYVAPASPAASILPYAAVIVGGFVGMGAVLANKSTIENKFSYPKLDLPLKPILEPESAGKVSPIPQEAPTPTGKRPAKVEKVIREKVGTGDYKGQKLDTHNKNFTNKDVAQKFADKKDLIDKYFDKYGTPRSLEYLVVMESQMDNTAGSGKGALGPWQFIASTGREYGLYTDADRMDWYKSTDAAARYLKVLYNRYNSEALALMAYNWGLGNVDNAIRGLGYKSLKRKWTQDEIWDVWMLAPFETQDYYLRWLAICGSPNYGYRPKTTVPTEADYVSNSKTLPQSPHNVK